MAGDNIYYFDNNATTRIAEEVIESMMPFFTDLWGNASAAYRFGTDVSRSIRYARAKVAELVAAEPEEIIFTSCGTESNNAAWQGALFTQPGKKHILTTAVEHSANMKFGDHLKKRGYEVTSLPVESDGSIDLHLLEKSIRPDTALVSIMWANNETGVVLPIEEIAAIARSRGALFHTDAVQVAGKMNIDVRLTRVDYLSLSAHKLHAPKGIGCLFVRKGAPFTPYVVGGGQERGCRGGTENVPYIVGFGRAAELAMASITEENTRVRDLRDRMENTILDTIPRTSRNGARASRLPNTSNLAFHGVEAEALLLMLDRAGICAATGSACKTGSIEPSHVLTAMGLRSDLAKASMRLSLGIYNTHEDVDFLLEKLPEIISKLRDEE
ncbi:MAG: cysteine desulfurase NifS [Verrucomicrobiales bacterium]|nr:cysteine desulfurase NifS [Verrucomicrobiales bacterium]|tara:strand:- start:7041 stop:8192 length:1152 start_codon:yes stop_codon:yes gene_type:complete